MDWDDLAPRKAAAVVIGEPLTSLSVDELRARIAILEAEIGRVKAEMDRKSAMQAAARAAFKT